MKTIGIAFLCIVLLGIAACSSETPVTPATGDIPAISSSTATSPENDTTRSLFEILAAANAEVASVKIANQAYAAEHEGKYPSSSSQLTKYLDGTPDATYSFNVDTGAITKAVNGNGITRSFHWDNQTQRWQK